MSIKQCMVCHALQRNCIPLDKILDIKPYISYAVCKGCVKEFYPAA